MAIRIEDDELGGGAEIVRTATKSTVESLLTSNTELRFTRLIFDI
jgi:hypothetical protein